MRRRDTLSWNVVMYKPVPLPSFSQPMFVLRRRDDLRLHGEH
ncbi:MAG: hypothetical protein ACXWPP_21825 [Ktedonobacteraceae bacterium]